VSGAARNGGKDVVSVQDVGMNSGVSTRSGLGLGVSLQCK